MSRRRKFASLVLAGYLVGLMFGQVRLPLAAVKALADYRLLRDKPVVSASDHQLQMAPLQNWYLRRSMNLVAGPIPPQISADVKWNWGVVARVRSGHYISPQGAEDLDALYISAFGAWVQVYKFSHTMA